MMDIREKIKKIMDKARSTTHEGEALTLMAKAEALLEQHQLGIHDLHTDDPIGMTKGVEAQSGPTAYKAKVQGAVARYYGCRPIRMFTTKSKWHLEIVGPESGRITAEMMFEFVWQQVNTEAGRLAKELGANRGKMVRQIANSLCSRIAQEVNSRDNDSARTEAARNNALVVVDAVEAWVSENYPDLSTSVGRRRTTSAAAHKAAQGISLHRQTGGSGAALRLGSS